MKLWGALSAAASGWMMILRGDEDWRDHFALTLPGLVTSMVIFLFCAFLAIAMASTYQGMPGFFGILDALVAQALWIVAVLLSVLINTRILRSEISKFDMMVPAIYLLVFFLLVGSLFNLVMPLAVLALTVALGYPFYRMGRVIAGWPAANALVFAVLTLVLLVGLPLALYMLTNTNPAI